MESAFGKRHPGEKHNPGEETSRPRQSSEACGKYRKELLKEDANGTLLCYGEYSLRICAYSARASKRCTHSKDAILMFFLFLPLLPVLFLIVFLSKIKKMKPVDSEEPQNTPIEDTTESINTLHLWNPIEKP